MDLTPAPTAVPAPVNPVVQTVPAPTATPTITQDVIDVAVAAGKGAVGGIAGGWLGAIIAGGESAIAELLSILTSHPAPTIEMTAATTGLTAAATVLSAAATEQAKPGATTSTVLAAAQAAAIPAAESAVESVVTQAVLGNQGPSTIDQHGTKDRPIVK